MSFSAFELDQTLISLQLMFFFPQRRVLGTKVVVHCPGRWRRRWRRRRHRWWCWRRRSRGGHNRQQTWCKVRRGAHGRVGAHVVRLGYFGGTAVCVSARPLLAMRPAAVRTACKAATHVLLARMLDAIVDSARICIYNANCQHSGEKKMRHFLLMVRKFTRDTSVTR